MKILTDITLRAHFFKCQEKCYEISKKTMLTPAAKDFIKEHGITLVYTEDKQKSAAFQPMPMSSVPKGADNRPVYVDQKSGTELYTKPENMTHLRDNILVPKTHPQICFRGMLDSLEAKILAVQVIAGEDGLYRLTDALGELLKFVREIVSAEVLEKPLDKMNLLGLSSDDLRYESHHILEIYGIPHPTPDYRMGRNCMALNELRTLVRESELAAAKAFGNENARPDIMEAMNRLSSCVYILFCRQLTGIWPGEQGANPRENICETQNTPSEMEELPGFMVEASGRHVHLTENAIMELFGEPLHKNNDLSQPGQFAAEERVRLVTPKGEIDRVVVLGPARKDVQVEMSLTDARILGIDIPVNLSGDLKGAGDVILVGSKGVYNAPGSVIASKAHIHMTPADAKIYQVEDGDSVSVRLETARPVTIDDVIVRVNENFALAMHVDYDEANACSYKKGDLGYIIKR